jgi:hypothetical protein
MAINCNYHLDRTPKKEKTLYTIKNKQKAKNNYNKNEIDEIITKSPYFEINLHRLICIAKVYYQSKATQYK